MSDWQYDYPMDVDDEYVEKDGNRYVWSPARGAYEEYLRAGANDYRPSGRYFEVI